jgi:hypothetical protein
MMTYTAPDGHIIESQEWPNIVTYTCPCEGIVDGKYESMETTGAATEIGIQQIKIKRMVENNVMTIIITMSTDAELIEYQNNNTI